MLEMKACEPERIETFRWLAHHVMISNAWSLEMPPPAKYKKGTLDRKRYF